MAQDDNIQFYDKDGELINLSALWKYGTHMLKGIVTSSSHQNIHNEIAFMCGHNAAHGSELANDASQVILLRVGASTAHLIRDVSAGGDFEVEVIEGVTVTTPGPNTLTIFNKYRPSSVASLCTAYHTPTTWSGGTSLPTKLVPGGSGGHASGGSDGGYDRELVLKSNTDYIFRVTNRSGGTQLASDVLEWYEPSNPGA